ncbi:MAG: ATPase, T2SS/T4P/T4SS family [Bacilli bacterium]|jgi:pilus assembly protein CpaF
MSDHQRVLAYLENSFLKPLLVDPEVTDVSFNGLQLHYVHNHRGRQLSDIKTNEADVTNFVRQIANLTEQHFSYVNPILDVSVGPYRLNAVGPSIARLHYEKAITFSLRIGRSRFDPNPIKFKPDPLLDRLFHRLVDSGISMVIAGKTGSGKTEFQKYLISIMKPLSRVIVIDNVLELEGIAMGSGLDMNIWQVNDHLQGGDFSSLIANGLRSHPDWVIVAEARGVEMKEALTAAMTGHPIITTVHSLDVTTLPSRMARMVIAHQPALRYAETLADIKDHFPILIHLRKRYEPDGRCIREIDQMAEMRSASHKLKLIYEWDGKTATIHKLSRSLQRKLGDRLNDIESFVGKVESTNE